MYRVCVCVPVQAMALGALPQNVPRTVHSLARMIDDVWHAAGDRSTDTNWYSKRALAAGVYAATEVYMLTDRSAAHADTWAFLDRRLEDVMAFGRVASHLRDAGVAAAGGSVSVFAAAAPSLFSALAALVPAPAPAPAATATQTVPPANASVSPATDSVTPPPPAS